MKTKQDKNKIIKRYLSDIESIIEDFDRYHADFDKETECYSWSKSHTPKEILVFDSVGYALASVGLAVHYQNQIIKILLEERNENNDNNTQ